MNVHMACRVALRGVNDDRIGQTKDLSIAQLQLTSEAGKFRFIFVELGKSVTHPTLKPAPATPRLQHSNLATLNRCKPRLIGGHTYQEVLMSFPPANQQEAQMQVLKLRKGGKRGVH